MNTKTEYKKSAITKRKILNSAKKHFSKYGYKGASIEKIAYDCNVNHSLIYHHFENKRSLWLATKQYIVENASLHEFTVPSTELPLEDFIKQLVHNNHQFYIKNPDIIKMINWQRMESKKSKIGVSKSKSFLEWLNALEHYQNQGDINPALQAKYIVTIILSITCSAAIDQIDYLSESSEMQKYLDTCAELILKAITNQ